MFNSKTKILVIDDIVQMRKVISKVLRDEGFSDITECSDGKEAWEKINSSSMPFGLIISDWDMPLMNGLELLKLVRGHDHISKTPFLIITGESSEEKVTQALDAGVDQYLIKPFSQDNLKTKLELVYKKRFQV